MMKSKNALKKYMKTLKIAERLARENRDAELLVAISDRWYALIEDEEDSNEKISLGFTNQEKMNDRSKASN